MQCVYETKYEPHHQRAVIRSPRVGSFSRRTYTQPESRVKTGHQRAHDQYSKLRYGPLVEHEHWHWQHLRPSPTWIVIYCREALTVIA